MTTGDADTDADEERHDLDRLAVVMESETGRKAALDAEVEEWLSVDVDDHVTGLGRPGYRDGMVEVTMEIEKWGNTGRVVASFSPQQAKRFVDEVAAAIDCTVVPSDEVEPHL